MDRALVDLVRKHVPRVNGAQARVNHCKPGHDNRAFYIKREGSVALFHCFHCGESGALKLDDAPAPRAPPTPEDQAPIRIPQDATQDVARWHPSAAVWVLGFGIKDDEIREYGITYSALKGAIFFPMIDRENALKGYQSRKFPPDNKGPKYVTITNKTSKKPLKLLKDAAKINTKLVICEDYLSAIKSRRFADSFCCFGTTLNIYPHDLQQYKQVYIWFDHDNRQVIKKELDALSFVRQFVSSVKIVKIGDPKRQSEETIKGELNL
jgi:hypothetical protein